MKLGKNKFHSSFTLNGNSFSTVDELLTYSKSLSKDIFTFLEDWFSVDETITVKTSGSTGKPKTIYLKKEYIINSAKATGAFFYLQKNTTALLCLPIQYIAGKLMLVRALVLGWQLDIVDASSSPLEKVTKTYDFSAMVPLQLDNSLGKINQIKKLIVGGGVVSRELEQKIQNVKTEVFATYGMTETITHIAIRSIANTELVSVSHDNTSASFYKTLPNIKIYKDTRNCLVIKAPKISDEVIFTNDVVELISDKQFFWKGRFDNIINSGGIKLQPEVIEEKLAKLISKRFFVAGIPDEKLGEKLVLIVEGKQQEINFTNCDLNKYEIPKETYFVDEFVETSSGKIQRKQTLQKIFLQGL